MLISGSMNTESVLGSTKFAALLTIVARCANMFHFNVVSHVVSHVSSVLTCVITICALPQTRGILPHFGLDVIYK